MRINIDKLRDEIYKVANDLYRAKSFTDYKSKVISFLSLYQTYIDLTGTPLDLSVLDNKFYVPYLKQKPGHLKETTATYFDNQSMHTELANVILITFQLNDFLDLNRELSETIIPKKKQLDIVRGFLSDFDIRLYNHFNHMLESGLIDDSGDKLDTNTTYFVCALDKSYSVVDNCKRIDELSTLMHEVAHSYVQSDSLIRSRKQALEFHKSFYELYSMYTEYSFHNYLKKNHIYIRDALLTENAHYSALRAYSSTLNKCGQIGKDTFIDTDDLSFIVDAYEYTYALYLGLLLHEKSLSDKEGITERIDDFIAYQGLLDYDKQLEILGFTRDNIKDGKILSKRLKEHNNNLRKYGHI